MGTPLLSTTMAYPVCAYHTADTDDKIDLDVTKADSMQECDQGSISYETAAEIWSPADLV